MRGFGNTDIFLDRKSYILQTEYRKNISSKIGINLFAGIGNIFSNVEKNIFNNIKHTLGFGNKI